MAKPTTKKKPTKQLGAVYLRPDVMNHGAGKGMPQYRPVYAKIARELAQQGMLFTEMAAFFDVEERTFRKWRVEYPELEDAIRSVDLEKVTEKVEATYAQAAQGYERIEHEIKVIEDQVVYVPVRRYYPPNAGAAKFWMQAKRGWRTPDQGPAQLPPPTQPAEPEAIEGQVVHKSVRDAARAIAFALKLGERSNG